MIYLLCPQALPVPGNDTAAAPSQINIKKRWIERHTEEASEAPPSPKQEGAELLAQDEETVIQHSYHLLPTLVFNLGIFCTIIIIIIIIIVIIGIIIHDNALNMYLRNWKIIYLLLL